MVRWPFRAVNGECPPGRQVAQRPNIPLASRRNRGLRASLWFSMTSRKTWELALFPAENRDEDP